MQGEPLSRVLRDSYTGCFATPPLPSASLRSPPLRYGMLSDRYAGCCVIAIRDAARSLRGAGVARDGGGGSTDGSTAARRKGSAALRVSSRSEPAQGVAAEDHKARRSPRTRRRGPGARRASSTMGFIVTPQPPAATGWDRRGGAMFRLRRRSPAERLPRSLARTNGRRQGSYPGDHAPPLAGFLRASR